MVKELLLSLDRGEQIFYLYLMLISLLAFGLMGIDKYKAYKAKWRIQELTLMTFAALGGSIGILFGMIIFKHKTNKKKFYIGVPLLYILNIFVKALVVYYI